VPLQEAAFIIFGLLFMIKETFISMEEKLEQGVEVLTLLSTMDTGGDTARIGRMIPHPREVARLYQDNQGLPTSSEWGNDCSDPTGTDIKGKVTCKVADKTQNCGAHVKGEDLNGVLKCSYDITKMFARWMNNPII
jgi:hypothetical protein